MNLGKWKKVTHNKNSNISPKTFLKSKWNLLKKKLATTASYLFGNKRFSSKQILLGTQPIYKRKKRSKWKKLGNSLHFITLSKKCVNLSKVGKIVDTVNDEINNL